MYYVTHSIAENNILKNSDKCITILHNTAKWLNKAGTVIIIIEKLKNI